MFATCNELRSLQIVLQEAYRSYHSHVLQNYISRRDDVWGVPKRILRAGHLTYLIWNAVNKYTNSTR